jgi:hypothetical protein
MQARGRAKAQAAHKLATPGAAFLVSPAQLAQRRFAMDTQLNRLACALWLVGMAAASTAACTREEARESAQEAKEGVRAAAEKVKEGAREIKEELPPAHEVKEDVKATAKEVGAAMKAVGHEIKEGALEVREEIREGVRE